MGHVPPPFPCTSAIRSISPTKGYFFLLSFAPYSRSIGVIAAPFSWNFSYLSWGRKGGGYSMCCTRCIRWQGWLSLQLETYNYKICFDSFLFRLFLAQCIYAQVWNLVLSLPLSRVSRSHSPTKCKGVWEGVNMTLFTLDKVCQDTLWSDTFYVVICYGASIHTCISNFKARD